MLFDINKLYLAFAKTVDRKLLNHYDNDVGNNMQDPL